MRDGIRALTERDRGWVEALLVERWGSPQVVSRGRLHEPVALPGFVAFRDGRRVGLLTYSIEGQECEIVTINSLLERCGVGTNLIDAVQRVALEAGCTRLWLITTNDNLEALRFYQRRGFLLVAVHRNAIDDSRKLKPEISTVGLHGIPLRDEIELEIPL
jgi:ribosomal protein S18 acetylase RimI-like enzyme